MAEQGVLLSWSEANNLLARYGLSAAGEVLDGKNSLTGAVARYGYPLTLKVYSTSVPHKSEHGLIRSGLKNIRQLEKNFIELERMLDSRPGINQIVIQSTVPRGVELVLGARRDPAFGPTVMVGLGGTLVEVLDDVVFGLAPLDLQGAFGMIDRLRFRKLLEGYRGGPLVNKQELASMLIKLGRLLTEQPDLRDIDLNPVIATAQGLAIVDLRIYNFK
ncbi:MAG: acetate--CoA ligase family protein [Peptococcaceae bacterium]|nr:acetate--CoA ligase family protein [Peptococcaceae bacterium]